MLEKALKRCGCMSWNFSLGPRSLVLLSLLLTACSTSEPERSMRFEQTYQPSGVHRYLLSEIPQWAHRSQTESCFKSPIRYVNFPALRDSFQFSYADAVQFQSLYNSEWRKVDSVSTLGAIPLRDEEALFFRVSDMIRAGIVPFRVPSFQRVHLVHIDSFVAKPDRIRALRVLMNSERMGEGHPVFVSVCHTLEELEAFLTSHGMEHQNIRLISADMLTAFDVEGELRPIMKLNVDLFFQQNQKLHFFSPRNSVPSEIEGNFKLETF